MTTRRTTMLMRWTVVAALLVAGRVAAQEGEDGRGALAECMRAAAAGNQAEARPATERAAAAFRARMQAAPGDVDARVGLAQVRTRCEIPFAEMMEKLALVD